MAIVLTRAKETTTTTGTGTYSLAGTTTGFQTFVGAGGAGQQVYYAVEDGVNWEHGIGTVTDATPDTLARTSIIASSNGGAAVNWGAGTKNVFSGHPASLMLGGNNLSELTDKPAAKETLGLLPTGQSGGSDNQVVRLSAANTWVAASQADTVDQLRAVMFKVGGRYYAPGSIITGLTLTANSTYYLSTAGAITTTPPTPSATVRKLVIGRSLSTTVLLFAPLSPQTGSGSLDAFDAGVKIMFFQAAAPVGWTKDTSQNDKALRMVSGTGGGAGGSRALSAAAVGDTTLTTAQIPNHTHQPFGTDAGILDLIALGGGSFSVVSAGSDQWATRTSTGGIVETPNDGAHNHALALAYVDVIACSKDS